MKCQIWVMLRKTQAPNRRAIVREARENREFGGEATGGDEILAFAGPDAGRDRGAPLVKYVDLSNMTIPPAILEMVPETVARENVLLPIGEENGALEIVMASASDHDTLANVQFILVRDILLAVAPEEQIVAAIHRHYGRS